MSAFNARNAAIVASVLYLAGIIVLVATRKAPVEKKPVAARRRRPGQGGSFQDKIGDALSGIFRGSSSKAPTPVGASIPHKYIRMGAPAPEHAHEHESGHESRQHRYRMGQEYRESVEPAAIRGPTGMAMKMPQGANAGVDIYSKRNQALGANAGLDLFSRRNALGANEELDLYSKRNQALGANEELDLYSKRNQALGATEELDLFSKRNALGGSGGGPAGVKLSDAYSTDYSPDAKETYEDPSPDDTRLGEPAVDIESQPLTAVYGPEFDFKSQ